MAHTENYEYPPIRMYIKPTHKRETYLHNEAVLTQTSSHY